MSLPISLAIEFRLFVRHVRLCSRNILLSVQYVLSSVINCAQLKHDSDERDPELTIVVKSPVLEFLDQLLPRHTGKVPAILAQDALLFGIFGLDFVYRFTDSRRNREVLLRFSRADVGGAEDGRWLFPSC